MDSFPSKPPSQKPNPPLQRNNYKLIYDPELGFKESLGKKPVYRFNGVAKPPLVVRDPRHKNPLYSRGIPKSGRPFLKSLQQVRFEYNEDSLGPEPPTQIFVYNLSPLVTADQLRYHFKSFGDISQLDLQLNPYTGTSLGLCRISFSKHESVSKAHLAAKLAVQQASGLKLSGKQLMVVIDDDGSKCEAARDKALQVIEAEFAEELYKREQQMKKEEKEREEEREKEREREREREREEEMKAIHETSNVPPWRRSQKNQSYNKQQNGNFDFSNNNLKTNDTSVPKDIENLIYIFIDDRFVPPDRVYYSDIKHHFRKFRYEGIYMNRDGFYITFNSYREASSCFWTLDKTFVQNCRIKLKLHDAPQSKKTDLAPTNKKKELPKEDACTTAISVILKDLEEVLVRDIKNKIAGPCIFQILESFPKPAPIKEEEKGPKISTLEVPESLKTEAISTLPHLPRFKKRADAHKIKLPTESKIKSKLQRRRRKKIEARPLHYQLNQQTYDSSDSEFEQEEALDEEKVFDGKSDGFKPSKVEESTPFLSETSEDEEYLEKFQRTRPKSRLPRRKSDKLDIDYTSSSETESDEFVSPAVISKPPFERYKKHALVKEQQDISLLTTKHKENEFSEDGGLFYGTLPYNYPEDDVLVDLDGVQYLLKDDQDLQYLREALASEDANDIGDPNYWAFRRKICKFRNGDVSAEGSPVLPASVGYERINSTGSARSEGYYIIPTAEKSQYLPLRNRSTVEGANQSTSRVTSRMHRVNNRRLAAGVEKSLLPAEADLLRFNALKARKKQLNFGPSRIHTLGLFAMENIDKNDMVIEYVGEVIRQRIADNREKNYVREGIGDSYLFRIDEDIIVDATKKGNIARFINHSCAPNCIARIIRVEGKKKIVIYADRDIMQGEELTYDYKFPEEADKIPCLCGAPTCRGYLN
ncbi:histone lysine methyltransferase Set1 [Schizosaccharomyces cryophilus OY26]|uniref:Histone-lysine N-methyltransferase, H3 lysine-4 specific n=1 Tax=Schizosaccharomyces cryophilus (strain OY26 / ATCC MYA-4695 / CBS 11777 / NBRC 106824 / NRRL Y48691) TaxID=653667 RepID=S9X875_SCHCR|nr:histone lysine methyltransferase Set1 [Schizosaccharomyces cryophilus OY26]EPY49986.1 histone lysine methyltransferase Set1 [Schizosaccharomyces cryophilus OY26]